MNETGPLPDPFPPEGPVIVTKGSDETADQVQPVAEVTVRPEDEAEAPKVAPDELIE